MGLQNREEESAELEPLLNLVALLKGCEGKKRNGAERLEVRTGSCGIAAGGHLVPSVCAWGCI